METQRKARTGSQELLPCGLQPTHSVIYYSKVETTDMHCYLTDLNISALDKMEKFPIGLSRKVIDDLYYFSKVKVVTCVCIHTFMHPPPIHTHYKGRTVDALYLHRCSPPRTCPDCQWALVAALSPWDCCSNSTVDLCFLTLSS